MHMRLAVLVLVGLATPAFAERSSDVRIEDGMLGLSFGVVSAGGTTAGISYNLTPKFQLRGDLGLTLAFAPAASAAVDIGVAARMYLSGNGPVVGFFQPGVTVANPGGSAAFSLYAGFGLEYFFTRQLSVAGLIAAGLNIAGAGGGATAVSLTTSRSGLALNLYW